MLWIMLFYRTNELIAMILLRKMQTPRYTLNFITRDKLNKLSRAIILIYTNRSIIYSSIARIINTLLLFGLWWLYP